MNYPKKPGFNLYQSRHCAYITYGVKTWFLKILSVLLINLIIIFFLIFQLWYERERKSLCVPHGIRNQDQATDRPTLPPVNGQWIMIFNFKI